MGKTYYVATSGNDKNAGVEESKPFRTIQRGIDVVRPGDTLLVRSGVYRETLNIKKSGTATNPIVIAAYNNESPIIDGKEERIGKAGGLVTIGKSDYLTFKGFELRHSGGRGIRVQGSSHITLEDCNVHECQSGGVFANGNQYLTMVGCKVHHCASKFLSVGGRAFTVAVFIRRCQNTTIEDNHIYENSGEGISIDRGSQRAIVRRNICYDNRDVQINVVSAKEVAVDGNLCYHTGRQEYINLDGKRARGIAKNDKREYQERGVWHTQSLTVTNNIVVGCEAGFGADNAAGALTNFVLAHNTFVNCTGAGIEINSKFKHSNTIVENNLFAATSATTLADAPSESIIWRHNLWSKRPSNGIFNPNTDVVAPNPGLTNMNAPVVAGQLSAELYKLVQTSPAINKGTQGIIGVDFFGVPRDTAPDIGAHEFPNGSIPGAEEDAILLPPPGVRVTSGLLTLYDFAATSGNVVYDVGGNGTPLNLTIADPAAVEWKDGGLAVIAPTRIASTAPADKISVACRQSNAVTLEAWIKPASTDQSGPARIVSLSSTVHNRNVTLGQGDNRGQVTDFYDVRLRTTETNINGVPSLASNAGSLTTELTHVVYTWDPSGTAIIYLNGEEVAREKIAGELKAWATGYKLFLANEATANRHWLGNYHLVAFYNRALAATEVAHNFAASLPPTGPMADFYVPLTQMLGTAPHTVEFNSSDSTAAAGIAEYLWDFGDGFTSTEANPVHVYEELGTFDVSLTVTDNLGLSDTMTKPELVRVVGDTLPPMPATYARFVLADVPFLQIMAFGVQFPDLRCVLFWNDDPNHMLIYETIEDVEETYVEPGGAQIVWIDAADEEESDEEEDEEQVPQTILALKETHNGHPIRRRK